MDNQATAQRIIKEIQYATVATTDAEGNPWNTPVFFASDGYKLFWSSHPDSVHSRNIAKNGKAFIVIYNSKAGQGEGIGLYIKATVSVLDNTQGISHGLELLGKRRGKPFVHIEKFMANGPQHIYMAVPLQMWTNDAHKDADDDFIEDFRVEVKLA